MMKNPGFLVDIVQLVVLGSITRMVLAIDRTEVDELLGIFDNEKGVGAVALKTKQGVIFVVHRERSNVEKTMKISEHIGCAMSGSARSFAHQLFCGEPRPIASTMQAFYDVARNFEETGVLPFDLLIVGYNVRLGPDYSLGIFESVDFKVIGPLSEDSNSFLRDRYDPENFHLVGAETIALITLEQMMGKVTPYNFEIGKVAPKYHVYTQSEVEEVYRSYDELLMEVRLWS
ncbi:hypothetical protein OROHE_005152 [Orobanche hederae]